MGEREVRGREWNELNNDWGHGEKVTGSS